MQRLFISYHCYWLLISTTVGEMSKTVGEMSKTVGNNRGNVCNSGTFNSGDGHLQLCIGYPRYKGKHVKCPLGLKKNNFRSESISWDLTRNFLQTPVMRKSREK